MKEKIIPFFLLFFSIGFTNVLFAQTKVLSFERAPLVQVFETLEQESDYVFNYDPELFSSFIFTGEADLSNIDESLSFILLETPYAYELNEKTILVYRPEPKTYRICGTILDAQSKELLMVASIAAVGTTQGTESNLEGFFDFELVADKNQKISISYVGYLSKSFFVAEVQSEDCPVYLMETNKDLLQEEIIITDYILDGIQEGGSFGSLEFDFEQLSKNHSNVEHDILKTVQLLPGVNSIDDSASNLQIRGSSPDQNLILWEGTPIYNAGHIFGMISAFNPFSVDKVNIYKGAYDPKYDNRVGGIIDISLTDSTKNTFQGSLGTTLTEVHSNLHIPIVKDYLSIVLSGRQSISGLYESPTLESYTEKVFQFSLIDDLAEDVEGGFLDAEQGINYHDWNAKLICQVSKKVGFNVGVYSNQQDFNYSISVPDDPFISAHTIGVNTNAVNADLNIKHNKKWSNSFSFYNSSYQNAYDRIETENGLVLTNFNQYNKIEDRNFQYSSIFNPNSKLTVNLGYAFNTKKVDLNLGEDIFWLDILTQSNELARFHNLFLSSTYATKKIKVDGGMRASYYQEKDKWVYSPRVNLQYFINKNWKLKADGGIYHQFISQLNDFGNIQLTRDNPLWILNATETELSQKSQKFALGLVFQNKGWLFDIDAYYNYTTGLSTVSPVLSTLAGDPQFSQGNSISKGVDLLLKKRWAGLNTWINYSLRYAENDFPEVSENPINAPNDIRHNVSFVTSYQVKHIQFSLNAHYHSGLPFSIPAIEFLDDVDPSENPIFAYRLDYDALNTERLKPYMRFDFSINYRPSFKLFKKVRPEASINFINLLNRENVLVREYYLDFGDNNPIPDLAFIEKVLLDRTPQVLLRFYW